MKHTLKRIFSVLLAAAMLFGAMPSVFAQGDIVDVEKTVDDINKSIGFNADKSDYSLPGISDSSEVIAMSTNETVKSGIFSYYVDENGNAIIAGCDAEASGNINVPAAIDGYAVASVDVNAFDGCFGITGITFSEGIGAITADLSELKNLDFVVMPTNSDYTGIKLPLSPSEVTVGNTLITLNWSDADKTTTLNIGSDIADYNKISEIYSCFSLSLETVNLSDYNTAFKLVDGVLYNSDVTTFYLYPIASGATSYVMPDTVLFSYDTVDYIDTLYYAYNLTEITIGKNFNIAAETADYYFEMYNDYAEYYGEEVALFFMPNLIFQLGDGASHSCIFPFSGNLEAINVSPDHAYLTSKDGVLCLKNDNYDVVLVYPGSKEGTITLGDNAFVYSYAFISLQEAHEFVITDGYYELLYSTVKKTLTDYEDDPEYEKIVESRVNEWFNRLLSSIYASEFSASELSKHFYTDEHGVLYSKDKTKLIRFPAGSDLEFYEIAPDTTFGSDAFLGFSPLSFKLYYPENLTVHINDLEAGLPVCKTVCTDIPQDTTYTTTDENGEEVTYTFKELVDEYNVQVIEARETIADFLLEWETMLENGEMTEYEYEITKNFAVLLFGGYLPEFVFCDGVHETEEPEEPDVPDVPEEPEIPELPPVDDTVMPTPTQTTINYGDSIVLHVDETKIPAGGYVKWSSNNGNFDMDASDDGRTCTISPDKSGTTTFTATIYDAEGKVVCIDEQEMTSKAGFFQKIIAFFKSLFGLTQVIPQVYKF
ncbi:MAG: hypothetical protein IJZ07_09235 [Clostridia bacterium]|nr:hypothetical protein [Clostridia bacterium]